MKIILPLLTLALLCSCDSKPEAKPALVEKLSEPVKPQNWFIPVPGEIYEPPKEDAFPAANQIPLPHTPDGVHNWQIVYHGPYQPNGADLTILDLFEHSETDVARARYPIAYFSAHYEDWRPDAKRFGRRLRKLGNWKGEWYVDWRDPQNREVMLRRLDLAKKKGFQGVDIDNVDSGPPQYFAWLFHEARARSLTVGLKNYVEILPKFGDRVDFFVSEASAASELTCYRKYGKPVLRMGYGRGAKTPSYIFETRNGRNGNRY